MARNASSPLDDSRLTEDDVDEDLPASPSAKKNGNHAHLDRQNAAVSNNGQTIFEKEATREASLRAELASVRKVNDAIEGVVNSLNKAQKNMKMVNSTVSSASTLLNTWTRILSQTEHNQRLILNPAWQGASQDIADMEQEVVQKQRASERRDAEEQSRRAERLRKVDEDERRRAEVEATSKAGPRGSTRGRARAVSRVNSTGSANSSRGSHRNTTGQIGARNPTSSARRTTSGVGRGYSAGRGRAKE